VSRRAVLIVVLAILGALVCVYEAFYVSDLVRSMRHPEQAARSPLGFQPGSATIAWVSPEAQAAGISPGDRLLSVAGVPYRGRSDLLTAVRAARAAETLTVQVQPASPAGSPGPRDVQVTLAAAGGGAETAWGMALQLLTRLVMPLFCILLGFWVAAIRIEDPMAWLLLGLMLSFSQIGAEPQVLGWPGWIRGTGIFIEQATGFTWSIWMMLFGIYFPIRSRFERRAPWAKWLLLVPLILLLALTLVSEWGRAEDFERYARVIALDAALGRMALILSMVAVGSFFFNLNWKYYDAPPADMKRRINLLVWGATVGLAPGFFVVTYGLISGQAPFQGVPEWLAIPSILGFFVFPITLAYVIVVDRAMDVRVVVRQGLQYALARGGVFVLLAIMAMVIILSMVALLKTGSPRTVEIVGVLGVGMVLMLLLPVVGRRLYAWIDRIFFREAYNAEQILSDLGQRVRTLVEMRSLLETVGRTLSESLHVPRVALLLASNGTLAPAHTVGFEAPPTVALAANGPTASRLREQGEALRLPAGRDASRTGRGRAPHAVHPNDSADRVVLEALSTQLLLPLATKEKLLGAISLGPKRSEEPYSGGDVRLLQSVAAQAALALENSQLTEAIASEVARRVRMNRELEIATEVQQRLFPQRLPEIPGLDFMGACRPARGVGGDYYDFLLLPDGRLGLAVGDVSGKGIPAALLMASLQASLRGQMIGDNGDLTMVMRNVNRLVYEASPDNRYATLFFARYDPRTRAMDYINAGHNAPVVLRPGPAGGSIHRLGAGGPVIGLLEAPHFAAGSIQLQPGDLFVAYSDGVSEAMNADEEEWGEERFFAEAAGCRTMEPQAAIRRLMAAADAFAAGAEQHDDMTLVIVKVR